MINRKLNLIIHVKVGVKLVGLKADFFDELKISIFPYLESAPNCKGGKPHRID